MVQLNLPLREINCKIVYFGPGLSGKTTNLEVVHAKAPDDSKGELTSIATESDRTLFFDFMPLNLGTVGGMKTKFQLYTVPGQVYYNSTRKLVLRGADGVIFVADSSPDKMEENIESLQNLEECLQGQDKSLSDFPHVIQYNKRDIEGALPVEEMDAALNKYGAPFFEAVASNGDGVIETFKALSGLVLEKVKAMAENSGTSHTRSITRATRGGTGESARPSESRPPAADASTTEAEGGGGPPQSPEAPKGPQPGTREQERQEPERQAPAAVMEPPASESGSSVSSGSAMGLPKEAAPAPADAPEPTTPPRAAPKPAAVHSSSAIRQVPIGVDPNPVPAHSQTGMRTMGVSSTSGRIMVSSTRKPRGHGLSTAAKVGIGVGIAIAGGIVFAFLRGAF